MRSPDATQVPRRTWSDRFAGLAAFARRAVEFGRQPAGETASSSSPHAERVSISDPAREASRGAGRPALGDVRWYRAVRRGTARTLAAQVPDDPAWQEAAGNAPVPSAHGAARNAGVAIAAYRANMPLAA